MVLYYISASRSEVSHLEMKVIRNRSRSGVIRRLAAAREVSERQIIEEALHKAGTVEGAANLLGISSNAVWTWMKTHGYGVIPRLELVKKS